MFVVLSSLFLCFCFYSGGLEAYTVCFLMLSCFVVTPRSILGPEGIALRGALEAGGPSSQGAHPSGKWV